MNTSSSLPPPLVIPPESLVVLAGPAGSGKSTFARRHFLPTQIVSSDALRGWVSDDEGNQRVSATAFRLLYTLVHMRLRLRRLTVVDSTALAARSRRDFVRVARRYGVPVVLILLVADRALCLERDARRRRQVGAAVIDRQLAALAAALPRVEQEGFDRVYQIDAREALQAAVTYEAAAIDRRDLAGPFDLIGDVHGCCDELVALLRALGYTPENAADGAWRHPEGRTAVYLGDLADRGPASLRALRLACASTLAGSALFTPGNHCNKLLRYLQGRKVHVGRGLASTVAELDALPADEREHTTIALHQWLATAPPYLMLDEGRLVVAHAGIQAAMIGQTGRRVISHVLYGDVSGETDAQGMPIRRDWAREYDGAAAVVYGHTVVDQPVWVNNTINIDTGCVFGGWLTALRWPERTLVQVPAARIYYTPDTPDLDGAVEPAA